MSPRHISKSNDGKGIGRRQLLAAGVAGPLAAAIATGTSGATAAADEPVTLRSMELTVSETDDDGASDDAAAEECSAGREGRVCGVVLQRSLS